MKVFAYTIHKDPGPNGPNMELHQTLDNLGGSKRKTVEWMVETDLEARPVKKELLKRLENGLGSERTLEEFLMLLRG